MSAWMRGMLRAHPSFARAVERWLVRRAEQRAIDRGVRLEVH